jgi:hypothetical protein
MSTETPDAVLREECSQAIIEDCRGTKTWMYAQIERKPDTRPYGHRMNQITQP